MNEGSKSYYSTLGHKMLDSSGLLNQLKMIHEVCIKTVRLRADGRPKESMSFPAFKYESMVEQEWEESDFFMQISRRFLFLVFRFETNDTSKEPRRNLIFESAFFWSVPDEDRDIMEWVWTDTREKVLHEDFEHFIRASDKRLIHIRPHAQSSLDTHPFNGKCYVKRCFWFNDTYVQDIVEGGMHSSRSASSIHRS